jgi:hypothetical protein
MIHYHGNVSLQCRRRSPIGQLTTLYQEESHLTSIYLGYEVFTVIVTKVAVFWDAAQFSLLTQHYITENGDIELI